MKKVEYIEYKVIGGKNEEFTDCASCKYWELPEASCRVRACIHAFDKMYDFFEKEK